MAKEKVNTILEPKIFDWSKADVIEKDLIDTSKIKKHCIQISQFGWCKCLSPNDNTPYDNYATDKEMEIIKKRAIEYIVEKYSNGSKDDIDLQEKLLKEQEKVKILEETLRLQKNANDELLARIENRPKSIEKEAISLEYLKELNGKYSVDELIKMKQGGLI